MSVYLTKKQLSILLGASLGTCSTAIMAFERGDVLMIGNGVTTPTTMFQGASGLGAITGNRANGSAELGGTSLTNVSHSLLSQNTFGMYSDSDPFDLAVDAAKRYKLDRWRLYTNLSNYESGAGNALRAAMSNDAQNTVDTVNEKNIPYYFLGTSGKIGPGSLSIFFETHRADRSLDAMTAGGYSGIGGAGTTSVRTDVSIYTAGITRFDGNPDLVTDQTVTAETDSDVEANNFFGGYTMDFGDYSVGIDVMYNRAEYNGTLGLPVASLSGINTGGTAAAAQAVASNALPGTLEAGGGTNIRLSAAGPATGQNYNAMTNYSNVDPEDNSNIYRETQAEVVNGNYTTKIRDWGFRVGSHIRLRNIDLPVYGSYFHINRKVIGDLTNTYNVSQSQACRVTTLAGALTSYCGATAAAAAATTIPHGYEYNYTATRKFYNPGGGAAGIERDGGLWGLKLQPKYSLSKSLALQVDMAFEFGDGDLDGGYTESFSYTSERRANAGAALTRSLGQETNNALLNGDWDSYYYSIDPKLFMKFRKVDFSLGVGYAKSKYEWETRTENRQTGRWSLDQNTNGDLSDANDFSALRSRVSWIEGNGQSSYSTWSFPVAAVFKVTDKLSIRAGAIYGRSQIEVNSITRNLGDNASANFRQVVGQGAAAATINTAPNRSQQPNGTILAYDPTYALAVTGGGDDRDRIDYSRYRLGLSYQVSENLNFDLMFQQIDGDDATGNDGSVSLEEVFASITLAF